ncbi:MAG: thiamine diphosphokinase [Treponema sp.]|nr:thiamine diphosphokinase [Treponema sp.]
MNNSGVTYGLAVVGGEGPEPAVCRYLAEKADLVAAADSGLEAAEAAGIVPDLIVGDMDSLDDLKRLEKYPADIIRRYSHDKDLTDTELALELLWEKGCNEVWIAGGGGGRLDHLLAVFYLFERKKCPRRWVTAFDNIYCLDGADSEIRMNVKADTVVSVLPLETGSRACSGGLKWPLDNIVWDRGSVGISNRAPEGQFFVRTIAGRFLVMVPLLASKAGFI